MRTDTVRAELLTPKLANNSDRSFAVIASNRAFTAWTCAFTLNYRLTPAPSNLFAYFYGQPLWAPRLHRASSCQSPYG